MVEFLRYCQPFSLYPQMPVFVLEVQVILEVWISQISMPMVPSKALYVEEISKALAKASVALAVGQ